jgi:UDP-N-acetylmuramate dehydrogenase
MNKLGYGGYEKLISVPAQLGGAIYMNAGVSPCSISDYIARIEIFHNGKIDWLIKEECCFSRRYSIFHQNNFVILGAEFSMPKQDVVFSKQKIKNRWLSVKQSQDKKYPNFGSVFKICNSRIMWLLKILHPGFGGAEYSKKTINWIVNKNNASYKNIRMCILLAVFLHKIFFRKIMPEIIEWK